MTNKQASIGILIFIIALVVISCVWHINHKQHIYTAEEQRQINAQDASSPTDFIFTEQEQRDIAKWKNKSFDDLVYDAHKGDAAALWLIGGCFLSGSSGFPLNTEMAYEYFERSATLGFAPAINDLAQRYLTDGSNVFLGLVYKNLTTAFGHKEFLQAYHDLRDQVVASFEGDSGKLIMDAIERIAAKKMAKILRNKKNPSNDKSNKALMFKKITDDDYNYDSDFWMDVCLDRVEIVDASEVKDSADEPYINELYKIFYQSVSTGSGVIEAQLVSALEKMSNAGYSDLKIKKIMKQAMFLAKSVYKFICKTEKAAEEAENKLAVLDALEASIK